MRRILSLVQAVWARITQGIADVWHDFTGGIGAARDWVASLWRGADSADADSEAYPAPAVEPAHDGPGILEGLADAAGALAAVPGAVARGLLGNGGGGGDADVAAQAAARAQQEQAAAEQAAALRERVQAVRRIASALKRGLPVPEDALQVVPADVTHYLRTLDPAELGKFVTMRGDQIEALLESAPPTPKAAPAPAAEAPVHPRLAARIEAARARREPARDRAEDLVATYG